MVPLDAFVHGFAKPYAASFAPTPTPFRDFFFNASNLSLYVKVAFPCFLNSSVKKSTHTPYIGDNVHCTSIRVQNKLDVNISWPSMEYSIVSIDFDVTSFLLQKYLGSFQRTSDAFDVTFSDDCNTLCKKFWGLHFSSFPFIKPFIFPCIALCILFYLSNITVKRF